MKLFIPAILFVLFSSYSSGIIVNLADLTVDKSNINPGEKFKVSFSVINRENVPYTDLILRYSMISDQNEIFISEDKISLAPKEVKDLIKTLRAPEIAGNYDMIVNLLSPSGRPITFISTKIKITGNEMPIRFSKEGILIIAPRIVKSNSSERRFEIISSGDEGENIPSGEIFRIRFMLLSDEKIDKRGYYGELILRNSYTEEKILERKVDIPLFNKSKIFEIPLKISDPGTYEILVRISDGKNYVERKARVVIIGVDGKFLSIRNEKDVYNKGDKVKIGFEIVGPADGSTIVKNSILKIEIYQNERKIYKDEKIIDVLPFNPEIYYFTFKAPEDMTKYKVVGILKYQGKELHRIEANYSELTPSKIITDDGRIILLGNYCLDDGICTDKELKLGNCYDCRNIKDVKEEKSYEFPAWIWAIIIIILFLIIITFFFRSKRTAIMLVAFIFLFLPLVISDPPFPPPPPIITNTYYQLVDEITSCGPYTGENQTIYYCPEPYLKTTIKTQGGRILSKTTEWVCGKNNNSYTPLFVESDWYCPKGKALSILHKPGNLSAGFSTLSSNKLIFRSNETVKFFFNAYVPACINRIPMLNLKLDLINSSNMIEYEKTGIYARHQTIDYGLNELGGVLNYFTFPEQEEFRKFYNLRATLKSYRSWSWRQRFAESLKRVVEYENLSLPEEIDLTKLPPGQEVNIKDLYVSSDFMAGGFSVNATLIGNVVGTNYSYITNSICNTDVRFMNITDVRNVSQLKAWADENNESFLEILRNLCNVGENSEIIGFKKLREIPGSNITNLTFEISLNYSDFSMNKSQFISYIENNSLENITKDFRERNIISEYDLIKSIDGSYGNDTANLTLYVTRIEPYHGLVEITIILKINDRTEESWNWRSLQNVTLNELAKCLYNWDNCLLNKRMSPEWGMESADTGYGPIEGSFVFNWSANQTSNYSKFYDGARGEETIEIPVTVYKSCNDKEWISKEGIYACINGKIYKCKFYLSADEIGMVERIHPSEIIKSGEKGGFICLDNGTIILDTTPPSITCDNCYETSPYGILFKPTITDNSPGSGFSYMKICSDPLCNKILCESNSTSCTLEINSCRYEEDDFYIYAEDRAGNSNIVYGGKFRWLKAVNCPCSFNEECLTGLCKGTPPICTENPKPIIDLV